MKTDLLPGVEPGDDWASRVTLREIRRKRRRCRLVGHLWTAVSHNLETGRTVLRCDRCYPHKDSQIVGTLYDLMPTAD
jgi:hypothetical protein